MNFLAHIYLSGYNEDIIIGNFIADNVKGKDIENYSETVKKGIKLHRKIDYYTDNHIAVKSSKKRLQNKYHKYSGVIVDIYYDHFLAANWYNYSNENINDFASRAYKIFYKNFLILPNKTKAFLPLMISSNWLVNYSKLEFLQRVFKRMAHNTSFDSGMENAVEDLKKDYSLYRLEFNVFFPDIIKFTNKNIKELNKNL